MDRRRIFLEAVVRSRPLLAHPAVADAWDHPSVLTEFSVRGLAGHLLRAPTNVVEYLDAPLVEDAQRFEATDYLTDVPFTSDTSHPVNVAIRQRGEESAVGGHASVVERWDRAATELARRLPEEDPARLLTVLGGQITISLDEYLKTRLVELLVHVDDLAVSVGLSDPELPQEARELVIEVLLGAARRRHGDLAVIRAFTRRERDSVQALRVI
jgi:hypothetical protein